MKTSEKGIAALEQEEGVVLRAYRDVVGVWTIGAGLTAASGVVTPKPGMVITRAEATALLQSALRERYEPSVEIAMTRTEVDPIQRPLQHEFDAAVSFHFNTGAIRRATWVKLWKARAARTTIMASMMQWNKGGGKVLPALTQRRERECAMLTDGVYPRISQVSTHRDAFAAWGLPVSGEQIDEVRGALRRLGYDPGTVDNAVIAATIRRFQADHGLTVDGIIGRATLTTLQRRLDAKAKSTAIGASAVAVTPATATDFADQVTGLTHFGLLLVLTLTVVAGFEAWRYRDAIAAKIQHRFPRAAHFLRHL